MATIKPVSFNRLPEIDENDGKVILHDGSHLGRSTKELGEIIDDRLHAGLDDGKQYVMTTSGWKDAEISENTDIVANEYNPAAPPQTYGTDPGLEHYCIYDLKLYRCKEVCIGENDPWNPNYWEETTISEELYKNNMMNDNDIDNILNELD